jgi:hypothetical protein
VVLLECVRELIQVVLLVRVRSGGVDDVEIRLQKVIQVVPPCRVLVFIEYAKFRLGAD